MMESEHEKMNNYSEINPYYLIYCNMNIKVHQDITKEAAENVVRQIGYLHNAMGFVFKDLIKILSFKFPATETLERISKPSPYIARPPNNNVRQAMDIELEQEARPTKQKQHQHSEERVIMGEAVRREEGERIEQLNIEGQKPPNTNIFDEYAYGKEAITEPKGKDKNSLKLGVVRIIEEVKKKKNEGKPAQLKSRNQPQVKKAPSKGSSSEKVDRKDSNPMREFIDKPIEQQPDIFGEFAFNKPSPIKSTSRQQPIAQSIVQANQADRNEQEEENRLWQFLKQRDEPPIYEISDDEGQ